MKRKKTPKNDDQPKLEIVIEGNDKEENGGLKSWIKGKDGMLWIVIVPIFFFLFFLVYLFIIYPHIHTSNLKGLAEYTELVCPLDFWEPGVVNKFWDKKTFFQWIENPDLFVEKGVRVKQFKKENSIYRTLSFKSEKFFFFFLFFSLLKF